MNLKKIKYLVLGIRPVNLSKYEFYIAILFKNSACERYLRQTILILNGKCMIVIQILQYDCLNSIYKIYRNNENLALNVATRGHG